VTRSSPFAFHGMGRAISDVMVNNKSKTENRTIFPLRIVSSENRFEMVMIPETKTSDEVSSPVWSYC